MDAATTTMTWAGHTHDPAGEAARHGAPPGAQRPPPPPPPPPLPPTAQQNDSTQQKCTLLDGPDATLSAPNDRNTASQNGGQQQ